ncbi:hypothetical protein Fcan01_25882 [Folsomia candida]|uniref:Hexosyltransferase n=2 Tax=Folsomia candida TaxID=158441 RepID=A0A226D369_FOLCA|nr:hypothetical protein Fcan01_25882 [Folsomia candida]
MAKNWNITIKFLFFLGGSNEDETSMDKLFQEGSQHRDLVIDDFHETYLNLTLKSCRMLKWVNLRYPSVPLLAKLDDDVYINWDLIFGFLRNKDAPNLIAGSPFSSAYPVADPTSKFYTPPIVWETGTGYPTYACGVFYILGKRVRQELYKGALSTRLFHMEDMFLTGIVRERFLPDVGIQEIKEYISTLHLEGNPWSILYSGWGPCQFYEGVAVAHSLSVKRLQCFFRIGYFCKNGFVHAVKILCPKE